MMVVVSDYWNNKLLELEKTLIKFEHSWHLEEFNALEGLSKIHETIGELHEFVHDCEDETALEECGIKEFLALVPQFPMLTTVTEREWVNLVYSVCKLSRILARKHKPTDQLLKTWFIDSADLLCQNLATSLELNISKQDWASHSPYMRNKRITPAIVFVISTYRRVTLQVIEKLGKEHLLNQALLTYSLYLTIQVLELVLKVFWKLQSSRTRLTQIRNDLLYFCLQLYFIFLELLKLFHEHEIITDDDNNNNHHLLSEENKNYFQKTYILLQILFQMIYFTQDSHMTNISVLFEFCENFFILPEGEESNTSLTFNKERPTKRLSISDANTNFQFSKWSEIDFIFNQQIIQQWNLQEIQFLFDELRPFYLLLHPETSHNDEENEQNAPPHPHAHHHVSGLELLFSSLDMLYLSPPVPSSNPTPAATTSDGDNHHLHHERSEVTVMSLSSMILSDKNYHTDYKLHLSNHRMANKMILFEKCINFQLMYSPEYLSIPFTSDTLIRKGFLQTIHEFFFQETEFEFFLMKDEEWKKIKKEKEETTVKSSLTEGGDEKSSSFHVSSYLMDENSFWENSFQKYEKALKTLPDDNDEEGDNVLKHYIHLLFQKRFEMIDGEYPKLSNEQMVLRNQNCQFLYNYKVK